MMDVTARTATTTTTATSKGGQSDYQTFLKMLTTQLQYQNPLQPMESSEFAVQLATFSGVEQQTVTNQLLGNLGSKLDAMALSDLSSWLGAEARVAAPIAVDGAGVTVYPKPDSSADSATLVVRDAAGQIVARETISPTASSLTWMPADATGEALVSGSYTLTTETYSNGTLVATTPVEHYAKIAEARNGPAGTTLLLVGGAEVSAAAVTALRR
ncbi:flagellar hook capping FlgD N-terminal domain-containing protein [Falsirhodobacter halotolerans]|uniref:flagellar hook capping FlgD N-terminal domain-containing protein n=1 Tax=Falsirhodobacter halotolerans TaxID=1146892 RepID=UPI001FCFFCDB|nr:flagellar hook capping FlgD N-terminal domain-containing protein [Falsirhodobacter halotolerans]MCJ8140574.1 flagellar hook assembly protein FlgD [Falsirhodobacter halotolerans]